MHPESDTIAPPERPPLGRPRRWTPPVKPPGAKLLVCGFQEYPGVPLNPAALIASTLTRARWAPQGYNIEFVSVPTRWADGADRIEAHLQREETHGVLLVNVDLDCRAFQIARTAPNARAVEREDSAGRRAGCAMVNEDGADRSAVTAPIEDMRTAVLQEDLSCAIVECCGGYVCGGVLHGLLARRPGMLAGHLALPPATECGSAGVLPLPLMQRGVQAAVTAFAASLAMRHRGGLIRESEPLAG